ncbi:DUF3243 family protein [Psychrobacillus soli]|uniref:DUF3243 domain-containing protein n=1 Tax=Psychrobacillus soli TaxID=1543965 RepID=A0A544TM38_9BACI|nr:DUF3243 domain-containing protein [Psychrobacillus soli]
MGLSEEKLAKNTELVANYLAKHENPRNREEKILMELWNSGSKEEQHALFSNPFKFFNNLVKFGVSFCNQFL